MPLEAPVGNRNTRVVRRDRRTGREVGRVQKGVQPRKGHPRLRHVLERHGNHDEREPAHIENREEHKRLGRRQLVPVRRVDGKHNIRHNRGKGKRENGRELFHQRRLAQLVHLPTPDRRHLFRKRRLPRKQLDHLHRRQNLRHNPRPVVRNGQRSVPVLSDLFRSVHLRRRDGQHKRKPGQRRKPNLNQQNNQADQEENGACHQPREKRKRHQNGKRIRRNQRDDRAHRRRAGACAEDLVVRNKSQRGPGPDPNPDAQEKRVVEADRADKHQEKHEPRQEHPRPRRIIRPQKVQDPPEENDRNGNGRQDPDGNERDQPDQRRRKRPHKRDPDRLGRRSFPARRKPVKVGPPQILRRSRPQIGRHQRLRRPQLHQPSRPPVAHLGKQPRPRQRRRVRPFIQRSRSIQRSLVGRRHVFPSSRRHKRRLCRRRPLLLLLLLPLPLLFLPARRRCRRRCRRQRFRSCHHPQPKRLFRSPIIVSRRYIRTLFRWRRSVVLLLRVVRVRRGRRNRLER